MKPDFKIKKVKAYNVDCVEFMAKVADNHYDLAIVDPPYGIGITGSGRLKRYNSKNTNWDDNIPSESYFQELKRISRNQIIWGGNYFLDYLGNTKCFLIWDKMQPEKLSFSSAELAWTNFNSVTKTFKKFPVGIDGGNRIHPTQKPVILYKWLLSNYAKTGDKIIDTHGGSCSIGCACLDMDFDIDIMEIDKEYFVNAVKRLQKNNQEYFDFA